MKRDKGGRKKGMLIQILFFPLNPLSTCYLICTEIGFSNSWMFNFLLSTHLNLSLTASSLLWISNCQDPTYAALPLSSNSPPVSSLTTSSPSLSPQFFPEPPGEIYLLHRTHSPLEPYHFCLCYKKMKEVGCLVGTTQLLDVKWRVILSFLTVRHKDLTSVFIKHYHPERFPWLSHLKSPILLYHSTLFPT